ncbi:MAG: hypothetical protein GC188_10035 [Alphaproteobacteria bacterium]|nr:hypothetical protein [Alphaproteobacteria bacterium]
MILSRISRAVREQNWFAVVLEFFIVVAGVTLGFQISVFGERAADRAYERDLLQRLDAEVVNIENGRRYQQEWLNRYRSVMLEMRPVIFGVEARDALTAQECSVLMESHYVAAPPDTLPALDELVATGRMQAIRNSRIRAAASDFLQKRQSARAQFAVNLANITNLPRAFPGLMRTELIADPDETQEAGADREEDGWDRRSVCDLAAMQSNPDFQTAAAENIGEFRSILRFNYDFVGLSLSELHAAIDAELGVTHDDEVEAEAE